MHIPSSTEDSDAVAQVLEEEDILITLVSKVRACVICAEHLPFGPRPIVQLHPQARILVASQAPGRKAHESGIPFADASGNRLREWLDISADAFYDPECVAILPMGFCYPGTGRSGDFPPRPECAPAWREPLLRRLTQLQLILVVGRHALAWHLPGHSASVTDAVRFWREHWPHVMPLPHPSPRNNVWLQKNPWFEQELLPPLRARVAEILNK